MRSILLKLKCKPSGGGCCGGKKVRTRYHVLHVDDTPDGKFTLISATAGYGNYLTMAKKEGKWAGSVFTMGLHEDADFMDELRLAGVIESRCTIV